MEYLDFEVSVEAKADGGYSVAVVDSPAGEASAEMRPPFDRLVLDNKMKALQIALLRSGGQRRSIQTADDVAVEEMGRDLYGALFSGEIAKRLEVSRLIASRESRGLRIKLRITPPELMSLPWEYLYDGTRGDYFSLGVATPIVRYVPLPQSIRPLEVSPPIRVLGMIAAPRDLGPIDAQRERQRLEIALDRLAGRSLVELDWVQGETWADLQEALWRGPWHVFHFIGHGGFSEARQTGLVYLSGEDGKARELSATDVGRLLGDHEPLRLAVLNSCDSAQGAQTDVFSSTAATLVRRGTPAVVAMQFQITDDAAIQFSRVFYSAIAHGMPVDAAVAEARKSVALQLANTYEWGTPVLFMRSRDGLLFRIPTHEREDVESPPSASGPVSHPAVDQPSSPPVATPTASTERPAEGPVETSQPQPLAEPAMTPPATAPQQASTEPQLLPLLWANSYVAAAVAAVLGGSAAMVGVVLLIWLFFPEAREVPVAALYVIVASICSTVGVFLVLRSRSRWEATQVAWLNPVFATIASVAATILLWDGGFPTLLLGIGALGLAAVAARAVVLWRAGRLER